MLPKNDNQLKQYSLRGKKHTKKNLKQLANQYGVHRDTIRVEIRRCLKLVIELKQTGWNFGKPFYHIHQVIIHKHLGEPTNKNIDV